MSLFNSLGSNYAGSAVWSLLFGSSNAQTEKNLKQKLADRFGGQVLLTYKGREALQLALKTALPAGSSVAINGFTCYAVYRAVTYSGHRVVFLDIDADVLHFSAQTLEQAVRKNPQLKAVIVQNTLGIPCEIEAIEKVCKKHKLVLIEDLAHSVGIKYADGREAGSIGDFVMLSFGRDKLIDTVSGGALIVRNKNYLLGDVDLDKTPKAAKMRDRIYPLMTAKVRLAYKIGLGKFTHVVLKKTGLLSRSVDAQYYAGTRLPTWVSKLVLVQLQSLNKELSRRRHLAKLYADNLTSGVLLPNWQQTLEKSSDLRVPIIVKDRPGLLAELAKHKIYLSDIWYDSVIAPPRYMDKTTYRGQCPKADKVTLEIINLPTHRHVKQSDVFKICEIINLWQQST